MNATAARDDNNTSDWLLDELPESEQRDKTERTGPAPWRVLIVDDDVDVHVVTKFSLSNTNFMGRRLSFLHAYSAAEALTVLRNTPDIALVLLDVIMESADAGLVLTRQIREELGNEQVRIVLRTGQPGQALEHSIVLDYEINDFWCKTDLTTRKLFTTVISSLRAYASLHRAAQRLDALGADMTQAQQVGTALEQRTMLLRLDRDGIVVQANAVLAARLQIASEELQGLPLAALLDAAPPDSMMASLAAGRAWGGELRLRQGDGTLHRVCATVTPVDTADGAAHYLAILAD